MEPLEKIIAYYNENQGEKDPENVAFLQKNVIGKSSSEIAALLADTTPDETGGIVAISGFYYQFLVAVEYIIDMLKGKWDYVFIEHLDDIVVGKDNTVRFIQVKSSEKVKMDASSSPASGLYYRTLIGESTDRKNNSWIDKLVSKAELLKKNDEYITQFQLYSSYHFIKTRGLDFDVYTGNLNYDMEIADNDHLLLKLIAPVCDKNGKYYDYENKCGEKPKELLSRFYLHTGTGLHNLDVFEDHLCMRLSEWLFRDVGDRVKVHPRDLSTLIGHLCARCTCGESAERLLVTKDNLVEILDEIRTRCLDSVEQTTEKHGNKSSISKIIDSIVSDIETCAHAPVFKDKLYTYREYLIQWVDNGGNIRSLIERYVDGTIKSSAYVTLKELNREQKLYDFFNIVFIMMIVKDSFMEFTDSKNLLTKKCTVSNLLFSFISLESRNNLESGLQKLESIIQQSDTNDHLYLLDKTLKVVFQNYTDRRFTETVRREIKSLSEIQIEGFEDEPSLNKVSYRVDIIPGVEMKLDFSEALDEQESFRDKMQDIWTKYCSEVN
ncbi:dsDNA nuclease domain-containing protein [Paenibacillus sp. FSL E2-0202]|uniref:dsDNA nuclease domain-containing protein n=1 Tax=Paenibacillus sp. FSL E2-0202 TaxID=2954505 RepID=UPI0030EF7088